MLDRQELHALTAISRRAASMMTLASFTKTHVWPHCVRDHRGRTGIFFSASTPLLSSSDRSFITERENWVVLVVIAAAKYSEGSKVPLDHIAFTDSAGSEGERWYYDLDMRTARKIHRDIVSGAMKPEQAFAIIVSSWEKISASAELAAN